MARFPAQLRQALTAFALAQFICSFAGSNMNVMITDIGDDLNTTVQGVQLAITLFLLVMAALMIPGGKLTDRLGRKWCLIAGLLLFGTGALLSSLAQNLPLLIIGYSIFEGVGTALLIPPVYILTTLLFTGVAARARAFGLISAMGGVGAVTGPLIGGFVASVIHWRAAFVLQALICLLIVLLSRKAVTDPLPADTSKPFDTGGAVLSALGLILIVNGILLADNNVLAMIALLAAGALVLTWFFLSVRAKERSGREPLLSTALFRNRTSNLGLVTQNTQWLMVMGSSFVISTYLQVVRGYNAIETGAVFTATTVGVLISSLSAERMARLRPQRTLIMGGFLITIAGIALLLAAGGTAGSVWGMVPGLFVIGLGLGGMLTPSVNVVQSAFPERLQGEISGLSRSVSNLGSSLGAALTGTILVAGVDGAAPGRAYLWAMCSVAVAGVIGLVAASFLPRTAPAKQPPTPGPTPEPAPEAGADPTPDLGADPTAEPRRA
ncbi:putative MFS transporter [Actinoplanes missouriensis 431]|uniref:Putative MFS transporter n=1 Tax=Actinoplanes missouriensis (strain ATCC 14538 / DSM 43046 / CBS 188.64 / JCM 3121 / NBRC 102363 / NCIMB 12654 / NRRL B-3342 / UNCC 431) TaxID=512565 RepID=I0H1Y1_ACTM4|nr:MFS transporter [Actinoplanes missouriensis]BAL87018.1 putative MFS transporter [Actinoplanes missouriensis 431]